MHGDIKKPINIMFPDLKLIHCFYVLKTVDTRII